MSASGESSNGGDLRGERSGEKPCSSVGGGDARDEGVEGCEWGLPVGDKSVGDVESRGEGRTGEEVADVAKAAGPAVRVPAGAKENVFLGDIKAERIGAVVVGLAPVGGTCGSLGGVGVAKGVEESVE